MVHQKPQKPTLEIHPAPFKPSRLSIPPSPFSPRTPLELPSQPTQYRSRTYPTPDKRYTPPPPLLWIWQCHRCGRKYPLGVTRRCLDDGHVFCSGKTTVKTWRRPLEPVRVKFHRACASEFDYQGWKAWGRWKRSGRRDSIYDNESMSSSSDTSSDESMDSDSMSSSAATTPSKDCWNTCNYPSECRWGRRFGIHTPVDVTLMLPPIEQPPPPPATTSEGILQPEDFEETKEEKKGETMDYWRALDVLTSPIRRKRVSPPSPLTIVETSPEVAVTDEDDDVPMGNMDPQLVTPQAEPQTSSSTASPSPVAGVLTDISGTLKKIIRKSVKRRRTSKSPERLEKSSTEFYEQALDELAPLERVKSIDPGYISFEA